MKKKIFIVGIISVGLLFLGFNVFGAVEYSRTPSGYFIYNPVSFKVYAECNIGGEFWDLSYTKSNSQILSSECVPFSTPEYTFEENLEFGEYITVTLWCYDTEGCLGVVTQTELESDEGNVIFEVGEAPLPPPPFVETPEGFVTNILAYIGQGVSGLGPLLWFIIGIPFAFWIIKKVTGLVLRE